MTFSDGENRVTSAYFVVSDLNALSVMHSDFLFGWQFAVWCTAIIASTVTGIDASIGLPIPVRHL